MFHITPTPLSWLLWALIWGVTVVLLIILGAIAYHRIQIRNRNYEKKNLKVWPFGIVAGIVLLMATGLSISSYYYNYSHSASYQQKNRNLQIEYKNNQKRTIELMNIMGEVYFKYDGYFSYSNDGRSISIIDTKTGKKIAMEMGQNDTFVVTDDGVTGKKTVSPVKK